MLLGYNTNGLAHHSLPAAIEMLAGIGYESVAITLDHAALNPYSTNFERELVETAKLLQCHSLRSVIETGARYLLDPLAKHEPTLLSRAPEGRARRIDFLEKAIDAAAALGSDCVSLWSGAVHDHNTQWNEARERLGEGLKEVLDYADRRDVVIGFEPEPGMLIDTMESLDELLKSVDSPHLKLTLDFGHLHCQGETPIDTVIRRWANRLVNVHIEDMRRGVHEHLMFGEGEIDFPPIIAALREVGYDGGVHVELSRHSHIGPQAAQQAYTFLSSLLPSIVGSRQDEGIDKPRRHEEHEGGEW